MKTNYEVQKVCQFCGRVFTARTTVTRFCCSNCASRAGKARVRAARVEAANRETRRFISLPVEALKAKEFLTARQVSTLLGCSVRSVYYYIRYGKLKAVNLGKRATRVKRSDIDGLFN